MKKRKIYRRLKEFQQINIFDPYTILSIQINKDLEITISKNIV